MIHQAPNVVLSNSVWEFLATVEPSRVVAVWGTLGMLKVIQNPLGKICIEFRPFAPNNDVLIDRCFYSRVAFRRFVKRIWPHLGA